MKEIPIFDESGNSLGVLVIDVKLNPGMMYGLAHPRCEARVAKLEKEIERLKADAGRS